MTKHKKWLTFALRWGIAIAGITYVVWNINFQDHVKVLGPNNALADMTLLGYPAPDAVEFRVWGKFEGEAAPTERVVPRGQVWTNRSDRPTLPVRLHPGADVEVLTVRGIRPASAGPDGPLPAQVLVERKATGERFVIGRNQVTDKTYALPNYPLIEIGLNRMTREADWKFLLAALGVMPVIYLLTSYRWHLLLEMLDIHVKQSRTFVLNMVGAFYNSFMPGSTGGDVLKAYYASKHTTHRTRAVMSVLVDRAIGLFALIILGGTMAAFQFRQSVDCRRVALASAALVALTLVGLVVFFSRRLRRASGLAWLLTKLPMQKFVNNAVQALELYGRRPGKMGFVLLLCFPVHITTIVSATFAGYAFGLELPPLYYWVAIPVIALVGAVPISPQGAGVMEFFAIKLLTVRHPVSVGQAVALVMSIRLVQMFWNLVAGLFVLRGGYHAPTAAEQHEMEDDEDESLEFRGQSSGQERPADAGLVMPAAHGNGEVAGGRVHEGGGPEGLPQIVPAPHRGV